MSLAAIIAGATAGVAGGWFNYESQRDTNAANAAISQRGLEMQDYWRRTGHQTEVKDLQAAGLNPVLSAGGGGAPTPNPVTATMQAPQIQMPDIMSMIQLDQAQQKIDIDKMMATASVGKNLSETDLNKLKGVLMKRGLPAADLGGEASEVLRMFFRRLKETGRKAMQPGGAFGREKTNEEVIQDYKNMGGTLP